MHKSHSSPPNYCHYHPPPPNYCHYHPPPPNYCHCHYHPPPPKLVNGYPRWNRHRRLYRSHLRMNNVDWASDDEEEGDDYHYQYPCHHEQPHQPMEDEYSYDSYPNTRSTTSSHTSSSSKSKSTKDTKSTKKTKSTKSTKNSDTCKTDTSTHDGRWTTTNDEKWTIATVMSNNDDCSCISDETNLSHEVHNYFVG
jgi:hypothetical protein